MRLLTWSDWRTQSIEDLYKLVREFKREGERFDYLLYAGDDLTRFLDGQTNHLDRLANVADTEVGFVRGNDDLPAELSSRLETDRVHDLHRNPIEYGQYLIMGLEGAVGENALGTITYSEAEADFHLESTIEGLEGKRIVLVSHVPPYGTLDIGQRFGESHLGSHALREFAEKTEPMLVICGHVHQFGGKKKIESFGPVVNVASHDDDYAEGKFASVFLSSFDTQIKLGTIDQQIGHPLKNLTQIGDSRLEELRNNGFENVDDLTWDRRAELLNIEQIYETVADKILYHAQAYRENRAVVAEVETLRSIRDREPLIIDIETNLARNKVWLIGAYDYYTDEFHQFFDLDNESAVCTEFTNYITESEVSDIVYYAGQRFDERVLSSRTEVTGTPIQQLDVEWTDVCMIARKSIFVPGAGHTLDIVASGLGYEFRYPYIDGFDVGSAYSDYSTRGREADWDRFLEYNQDDVLAVKHILDFVADESRIHEGEHRISV